MSDDDTKSILLVKKADSKKGSFWNKLTTKRIIKQHGGFDIPEGDNHAIPKYESPVDRPDLSSEETKEALNDLEKEIKELKERNERTPLRTAQELLNRERLHDKQNQDDDGY